MARRHAAAITLLAVGLAGAPAAQQQGTVAAAKEAYANAEYDRCVTLLQSATPSADEIVSAGEYRALCLVALDREADAEKAIEEVLRAEPLYKVPANASPRLKALVSRVKRNVLPAIVQERYAAAKNAYDGKDTKVAASGFRTVIALLDDPDFDVRANASLAGLKTVASGFLDLIAAVPPPAPPVTAPAVKQPPRIYTVADAGITQPEIIEQTLPPWRPEPSFVRTGITLQGTVEVIVDEKGGVESARLVQKLHPDYDSRLLRAARAWKYRPARQQNGTPVKFRKVIEVTLKPS